MLNNFETRGIKSAKHTLDINLKMAQKHHFKVKKGQIKHLEKKSIFSKIIKSIVD